MKFPERFSGLPDYAFPRLRTLLDAHDPGGSGPVFMSIGEPKHAFPDWVGDTLAGALAEFGRYPPNEGSEALLDAISGWIERRHGVAMAPNRIMALNGSREGLFNTALALVPAETRGKRSAVLVPNPFYQAYAVGAAAAGAEAVYVPALRDTGYLPDFAGVGAEVLARTAAVYVCSPSNPQGAVAPEGYLADLLRLAETHDFRVIADECYSEIYRDAPPPGILAVADRLGTDPERVVAINSLSKRSNLPGLRSGFVVAGPRSMAEIRRLRAYAGAPLPLPLQRVAERAWADEDHVAWNRARYRRKYEIADRVFAGIDGAGAPEAGFFLWLEVDDGEAAALRLWRETGIRVLPGAYLAREAGGVNPGAGYIRVAMVVDDDEALEQGLTRLRDCLYG